MKKKPGNPLQYITPKFPFGFYFLYTQANHFGKYISCLRYLTQNRAEKDRYETTTRTRLSQF